MTRRQKMHAWFWAMIVVSLSASFSFGSMMAWHSVVWAYLTGFLSPLIVWTETRWLWLAWDMDRQ